MLRIVFSNFCDALRIVEDPEIITKQQNALVTAARITEYGENEQTWHNEFMKFKLYQETRSIFNHYYLTCKYFSVEISVSSRIGKKILFRQTPASI